MARVILAPEVFADLRRFLDHMTRFEVQNAAGRITSIVRATEILTHSPLIGRPAKSGRRELVIGRGAQGYVALYRFIADSDTVFVLAIRSQREADYKRKV